MALGVSLRFAQLRGRSVHYPDAIADFDGKTISYTYENGWSFTNTFEGNVRHSSVPRGELHEIVEATRLREDLYLVTWIDDEMGLLAQIVDFEKNTVLAAIPVEGASRTETLVGQLADPSIDDPAVGDA